MRQIKFRAFDDGKMVYEKDIAHISMENTDILRLAKFFCNVRDDSHIMQFTGLLDKNGKEIYEGDVLHVFDNEEPTGAPIKAIVEFSEGRFAFRPDIQARYADYIIDIGGLESEERECEVIGNIYENPELVK